MGIVKVSLRRKGSDNYGHQSSLTPAVYELEQGERIHEEKDHVDDSDGDCELADLDCEFVKIGDQRCSVPYDIYDLADLKEVLSLETWNTCLSEEERFSLSAYLPDMDQEAFRLTMKELLGGENVFFGSTLEVFFQRLKGGFFSVKVAQFREVLQCMHRRGYYHSLRLYHENMAQTFMDMKKAWFDCLPSIDVEERVRIWNKRKDPKPVCIVDLNAIPADDEVLTIGDKNISSAPLSKKMKCVDNRAMDSHVSAPVFSDAVLSLPKMKPKGVLKIRPIAKNSEMSSTIPSLPCDSWGKLRPTPKGVLKIKPRSEPLHQQERPGELPIPSVTISAETSALQTFRFSPPQQSTCKWDTDNVCDESSFPHQKVVGGKFNGSSKPPFAKGLQRGRELNRDIGSLNNLHKFERRKQQKVGFHNDAEIHCLPVKNLQKTERYSDKINDAEKQNVDSLGQHSDPWSMGICPDKTELHPSALAHCQARRQTLSLASGTTSKTSTVIRKDSGSFGKPFDQMEQRHKDTGGKGLLKPSDHPAVAGVLQEGFKLPLTYKRKKGHSKRNSLEHVQKPIEKADFEMRMAQAGDNHVEEAKSMKIKLKMWNAPDTQYKQGLLNGL
uniref:Nuclear factor related to kappa-B-binding protein n=1 Tax=Anthurium amnicola TaxID=1678845 RepID=A0A1D1YGN1_9ARAE